MTRTTAALAAACAISLFAVIALGISALDGSLGSTDPVKELREISGQRKEREALSPLSAEVPAEEPSERRFYVLRDCGGFVGVYSPENSENPELITEIVVARLRSADAEKLKSGITVEGVEELIRILEDFGS